MAKRRHQSLSNGSMEFREETLPQMVYECINPSLIRTTSHPLSVTWAEDFEAKASNNDNDSYKFSTSLKTKHKSSSSPDQKFYDSSGKLCTPVYKQPLSRPASFQNNDRINDDEEEDYTQSVSAIMQRRFSVRGYGYRNKHSICKSLSRRASSSPMDHVMDNEGERRRSSVYTTTTSSDEGTNQESTQEQIYENIRLHKEVIQSVKFQPWPMRKKLKLVRQAKTYVARHEGALQERFAMSRSTKDLWARFKILMAARWRHWKRETTSLLTVLIPWELRIKEIESHFGSGVASYFTFLRWLMWVNIMIAIPLVAFVIGPEYFATKYDETDPRKKMTDHEYKVAGNLFTIWEFEGYLKYSPMFYGYYSSYSGASSLGYKLPLAYFLTNVVVYIYSFVATLRKMAENSRNSKLSSKDDECTFSWKLFTGWDFMIGHAETAQNRVASVVVGFKEALVEEAEKKKDNRNWRIILQRILVNILVTGLLAASGCTVVTLVNNTEKYARSDNWLKRNAVNVTIGLLSFFMPMIFEALGLFENWHPRLQLRLQLARIMILNMLNLYSLMFSFIYQINSKEKPLQKLKLTNDSATQQFIELKGLIESIKSVTTIMPVYSSESWLTTFVDGVSSISSAATTTNNNNIVTSATITNAFNDSAVTAIFPEIAFNTLIPAIYNRSSSSNGYQRKCYNITVKCWKDTTLLGYGTAVASTTALLLFNLTTMAMPPTTPTISTMSTTTTTTMPTIALLPTTAISVTASQDPSTDTRESITSTSPTAFWPLHQTTDPNLGTTTAATTTTTTLATTITTELGNGEYSTNHLFSTMDDNDDNQTMLPLSATTTTHEWTTTIEDMSTTADTKATASTTTITTTMPSDITSPFESPLTYSDFEGNAANDDPTSPSQTPSITSSTILPGNYSLFDYYDYFVGLPIDLESDKKMTSNEKVKENEPSAAIRQKREMLSKENADDNSDNKTNDRENQYDIESSDETTLPPTMISNTEMVNNRSSLSSITDEVYLNRENFEYCIKEICDPIQDSFIDITDNPPIFPGIMTSLERYERELNEVKLILKSVQRNLTSMCWETSLGQEMSKILVFDGIMLIVASLCMDFLRALFVRYVNKKWCWDMEKTFPQYGDFKIAENILNLIYNQGQVWMGIFFSPGLVIINLVKLIIMMYFRSWIVLTCNVPHEVVFKASKSNNFYLSLLLMMLFLCVLPVSYAIVWLRPSWHCGPFSDYNRISEFITNTTRNALPKELHEPLDYMTSSSTVIPLLLLLILIIYYLVSLTGALREANQDLRTQLQKEREEERKKIFKVPDPKTEEQNPTTLSNRWRKVLEASSPLTPTEAPDFDAADYRNQAREERITRIMKEALRKSSATSDDESAAVAQGRDGEDSDSEHDVSSMRHDNEVAAVSSDKKCFALTKLQNIRRTRRPSLADIVKLAKNESEHERVRAGSTGISSAIGEVHPNSRFKVEQPLGKEVLGKPLVCIYNDPDTCAKIVHERREGLFLHRKASGENHQKKINETPDSIKDRDGRRKSVNISLGSSNFEMIDEKKSKTKPHKKPENEFKTKRIKMIAKDSKVDQKNENDEKPFKIVDAIPKIGGNSTDEKPSEPQKCRELTKFNKNEEERIVASTAKHHNSEMLVNFSRQGRKKIGSLLALVREAVHNIKIDRNLSSLTSSNSESSTAMSPALPAIPPATDPSLNSPPIECSPLPSSAPLASIASFEIQEEARAEANDSCEYDAIRSEKELKSIIRLSTTAGTAAEAITTSLITATTPSTASATTTTTASLTQISPRPNSIKLSSQDETEKKNTIAQHIDLGMFNKSDTPQFPSLNLSSSSHRKTSDEITTISSHVDSYPLIWSSDNIPIIKISHTGSQQGSIHSESENSMTEENIKIHIEEI